MKIFCQVQSIDTGTFQSERNIIFLNFLFIFYFLSLVWITMNNCAKYQHNIYIFFKLEKTKLLEDFKNGTQPLVHFTVMDSNLAVL